MTRKIKFRAWHKKEKRMYYSGNLDEYNTVVFRPHKKQQFMDQFWGFFEKDLIIMQYTGKKDKTGKEIYEEDIIKTPDGILDVIYEGYAYWCFDNYGHEIDNKSIEILGNNYQNPELRKLIGYSSYKDNLPKTSGGLSTQNPTF